MHISELEREVVELVDNEFAGLVSRNYLERFKDRIRDRFKVYEGNAASRRGTTEGQHLAGLDRSKA